MRASLVDFFDNKTKNCSVVPTVRIETGSSGEVRTREGERLEVRCEVTGFPPPSAQWYRQVREGEAGGQV